MIAVLWLSVVVIGTRKVCRSPGGSVGLPIAFLFSMSFQYSGFIAYLTPNYDHMRLGGSAYLQSYEFTDDTVLAGVEASLLAIFGFVTGCFLMPRRQRGDFGGVLPIIEQPELWRRTFRVLGVFTFSSFLLHKMNVQLPLLAAWLLVGRNTGVALVCSGAALALASRNMKTYRRWFVVGACIPATYVLMFGFTSYGFAAISVFAAFWLAALAPRRLGTLRIGLGVAIVSYGLLTLFVAWMSFREELRSVLWNDSAGIVERFSAIGDALAKIELFTPTNLDALDWLNSRLNQYVFVGKTIEWHALYPKLQHFGDTLLPVFFVWVPRFLWPDKPAMGGSTLLSESTGMNFQEGVTFAAGPVIEFYANFHYVGIFVGFVVLGFLLSWFDRAAARALREQKILDFLRIFVTALNFTDPQTDFFFMVNAGLMSWLAMSALKYGIEKQELAAERRLRFALRAKP